MEYKDYYKILGVERDAKEAEIKTAYRRLARKYHPDVSKEKNAEEKFKEVSEAYEVLKDPEKRQAYNQLGANWKAGQNFTTPPGWEDIFSHAGFSGHASSSAGFGGTEFSGSGFSDFFESLFGGGFTQGGSSGFGAHDFHQAHTSHAGQAAQGADQHATISITLEEAYHGAKKTIRLGNGITRKLGVKIPKGITTGQRIRLSGQGSESVYGGRRGDLYLEVQVSPHSQYKLEEKNILLDFPISPWEAALGAKVEVPTLGGRVEMNIPAGSQSGKKLRLKNRGLPNKNKRSVAGDQIVSLHIVLPPMSDDKKQQYYQDMAKRFPFDPRKKD